MRPIPISSPDRILSILSNRPLCRSRGWSAQRWILVASALVIACAQGVSAVDVAPQPGTVAQRMLDRILAGGPRFIGLPGHGAAADLIEQHLRGLERTGDAQLIVHEMEQVVPIVTEAHLSLDGGVRIPIYPCWPNGAMLSATPHGGLSGPLRYVGDGHERQLPAESLQGAIVALEYNSYDRWKTVFDFGAAAVLFLPPQRTTWVHSHGKFADIPFQGPRFYLEDDGLAESIRRGGRPRHARIVCRSRWASRPVRNFVFVIPGRQKDLSKQVVVLNARYDAACVVPQLAFGAEQAISAAALCEIAADLARHPPPRTAVLIWTGADAMNYASLRAVLGTAAGKDKIADAAFAAAKASVESLSAQKRQILGDWRRAIMADGAVRGRYEMQIKHRLVPIRKQLRALRREEASKTRITRWSGQQERLNALRAALQRGRIHEEHWSQLEALNDRVVEQIDAEAADAASRWSQVQRGHRVLRPLLSRDRVVALLAVDLTSQGEAFGIYWQTHWQKVDTFSFLSRLGRRLVRPRTETDPPFVASLPGEGLLTDTLSGNRDWQSDVCSPLASAADVAQHFGHLALPLVTAYDGRWLVDSPLDRRDRLNDENIRPQVAALRAVTRRAVSDRNFRITNRLGPSVAAITGQAVVPGAGDARMDVGRPGRLVTVNVARPIPRAVGTRWMSAQLTSATGHYAFEHLSSTGACGATYLVDVLGMDDDGRIVEVANQSESFVSYKFAAPFKLGDGKGVKSVMFDCVQQSVGGLRDPRYLQELTEVRALLKRTGDVPRYHAVRAANGLATVMLRPEDRWLMTFSRGHWGIRMLMIGADDRHPAGKGFRFDAPVRSALRTAAADFYHLNRKRLSDLAAHGITAALADDLQDRTWQHLEDAGAAEQPARNLDRHRAALATQQVVYGHVIATGNDVIKAVIFLMIVLIPFSFYSERLFIRAGTIYGRIAGFVTVHAVMMTLLYWFHPAFRISATPLVVLLAFALIVLSSVVIFILYGRFAAQLRSRLAGEHSTNLARLDVVARAMEVGVANMQRRKIRTGFTLATLVVLTFTLLSLSGTRTDLSEMEFRTGARPTYRGILVNRLGWQALPDWFLEQVEAANATDPDATEIVVGGQYWLAPQVATGFEPYVVLRSASRPRRSVLLSAVMGVGPHETRFLSAEPRVVKLFDQLANDPDGCFLPRDAADRLGAVVGESIQIAGRTFRICGLFDPDPMARLRYLSGHPYGPIDLAGARRREHKPDARQTDNLEARQFTLEARHVDASHSAETFSPNRYALIGAAAARDMGATLHSICIQTDDAQVLDRVAGELSSQRLVPVYRSKSDGVQVIATRSRMSIIGLGDLIIPMAIGVLIVLNTMINAVSDQRSTIHIYTSLGLAPVHVGVLFLSEAAALGTLGVVGGFVVGQGFATLVTAADLAGAVTLNYSSTSVMLTMAMIMAMVMLSAIYPARMAGRLAVPGESQRWELPPAGGDTLRMTLPFTVSALTARGVCAFLHEWLRLHTEAGAGPFVSEDAAVVHRPAEDTQGVRARAWLAPYDAGVSQDVLIEISPTGEGGASTFYEVAIRLTRLSGQSNAWMRSNRAFVAELRKQFLLWRGLSAGRRNQYLEQTRALLADDRVSHSD